MIDRTKLAAELEKERVAYVKSHPKAHAAFERAKVSLFGGVPMTWMRMWAGGFPVYLDRAQGNRITDIDGHTYVDFALGDTGAMAGHSPAPTVRAVEVRMAAAGGMTAMLPTEDAAWVGSELARRFGVPLWSFALSATDANRWALRLARLVTARPRILVFAWCYHGTVDETFVVLDGGVAGSRPGNVGPAVDPTTTTAVCEFNDLDAVERELARDDIAAVLTEPALTNIGIVLPAPGFLEGLREITARNGTLLVVDETHTLSAGPGGATAAWGLRPDIVTVGKAIGGGVPIGAYGISAHVAHAVESHPDADLVDVGGVGGTLAGNALSLAATRATLAEVLTPEAFTHMTRLADRFTAGVQGVIDTRGLPWSVTQLGARTEYRFTAPAPTTGGESAAVSDPALDEYIHLYLANRGILMTPFHNMALMCPATSAADVDLHTEVFGAAVDSLT